MVLGLKSINNLLQKEPNGQEQELSGHRTVKIKDLRVSWKWPVCKTFWYGKDVRKILPVTVAAATAATEICVQKSVQKDITIVHTKYAETSITHFILKISLLDNQTTWCIVASGR